MKVLKLILASVFLSSCFNSPGIEEPFVYVYVIKSDGNADCIEGNLCPKPTLTPDEMIGYQCVSPNGAAKINSHHEVLHEKLNER